MPSFDPSVIASIGDSGPDVSGSMAKGFQLKDMLDENVLNQFKLRQAKQTEEDTATAREIASKNDFTTSAGAAKAAQAYQKAGMPDRAMDALKAQQSLQSGQYEQQIQQLQLYQGMLEFHASQFDPIYQQASAMRADGKHTDAEVNAYINSQVPTVVKNIQQAPDDVMPAQIKQAALQRAQSMGPMTYDMLQNVEMQSKQGMERVKQQLADLNVRSEIKNREQTRQTAEGGLEERKRHDKVLEDEAKQRLGTEEEIDKSAHAIANYQMAPPTGASRSPAAMRLMARVMEINPDFDANQFQSRRKAESDFATGKQGQAVKSFNVALSHLDVLSGLADALQNGNIKLINKAAQEWASQTGGEAPTDFNAAKHIVGDEIVKAVVGAGGGVADRENAAKTVDAANSPAQLKGVIRTYKSLMQGQLQGLKRQYESTTGRTDFDKFLSEEAQQTEAPTAPAAAPTSAAPSKVIKWSDLK